MERRFIPGKLTLAKRADGKGDTLAGYASVFYSPDDEGSEYAMGYDIRERIMPTAFDRAAKEDDCRALFNHDVSCLLGRTSAGTLRLSIDATGLRYEIDPPDTEIGRSVTESIRRGDLTGSSFSFDPEGVTWRELDVEGKRCIIREVNAVRLFDVGPVTFPAYESASVAIRSEYDHWRSGRSAPLSARLARVRARAVTVSQ